MIKDIRILQRAFLKGKKAGKMVRRSKLYYLLKRDPSHYTVKYDDEDAKTGTKGKNKGK